MQITITSSASPFRWEGFGYVNDFSLGDSIYDLTFSDRQVALKDLSGKVHSLPGLKLNLLRVNIGYGVPIKIWNTEPTMKKCLDYAKRAVSTGVDNIELRIFPPLEYKTDKKCFMNDIKPNVYEEYAAFASSATQFVKNNLHLPVTSVDFLNEPSASWYRKPGCNPANVPKLLATMRKAFVKSCLGPNVIKFNGIDDYNFGMTGSSFPVIKNLVDRVTFHDYSKNFRNVPKMIGERKKLRAIIGSKPIWMSEENGYECQDRKGFQMAMLIATNINVLRISGWYFVTLTHTSLCPPIRLNSKNQLTNVDIKFYMMPHFTRYIRPGDTILESSDPSTTVFAYDAVVKHLKIVRIVQKTGAFSINIAPYKSNVASVVYTDVTGENLFKKMQDVKIVGDILTFSVTQPGYVSFSMQV